VTEAPSLVCYSSLLLATVLIYCCFHFRVALPSERRLRAPRSAMLEKCRARG
jgi:hypothetical protein